MYISAIVHMYFIQLQMYVLLTPPAKTKTIKLVIVSVSPASNIFNYP